MKKFIVIGLMLLSTMIQAQNRKDLEIWRTIPDSFQGVYESYLVSENYEDGWKHGYSDMAILSSKGVWSNNKEHKPTAIYTQGENTLILFFAEDEKNWTITKTNASGFKLIVEDTKIQSEIIRVIGKIK